MKARPLTQKRLKLLLRYNRRTGLFHWLVSRRGPARAGDLAGCTNVHGYIQIGIDGKQYLAARLAIFYVTGKWPIEADHRHLERANNRWRVIRRATHSQNQANKNALKSNTSGRKGVSWDKVNSHWRAKISIDGKTKSIGRFTTLKAASAAYTAAARAHFGEYARS